MGGVEIQKSAKEKSRELADDPASKLMISHLSKGNRVFELKYLVNAATYQVEESHTAN